MARVGRLHARLDRLVPVSGRLRRIVTIFPEDWPPEAQNAYDQASLVGDTDRQAAIIRQQTGEAVNLDDGSRIKLIEMRTRDDGPA